MFFMNVIYIYIRFGLVDRFVACMQDEYNNDFSHMNLLPTCCNICSSVMYNYNCMYVYYVRLCNVCKSACFMQVCNLHSYSITICVVKFPSEICKQPWEYFVVAFYFPIIYHGKFADNMILL